MIRAYQALMVRLKRAGIIPKKHILDNEISENMKNIIRDDCNMEIELVPPGCHRRNAAEVAIRNFKAHFLSVLSGVAEDFPLQLWDRLLPQTEITLNLLRQSNATPTVSAYAHMSGPFDYNKMPLAPMGCGAQVHEKTDKRGTWAYHSVDGWYLYTSPEHYRTHACHIKSTRGERLTDTIQFKHKHITNPTITHADKIMQAMSDCISALKGHAKINDSQELHDLQQAVEHKQREMQHNSSATPSQTHTLPRVQPVPRVDEANEDARRITRSMTPLPRVPESRPLHQDEEMIRSPPVARKMPGIRPKRRKRRVVSTETLLLPEDAPAANTRSKTTAREELAAPPAMGTRSKKRVSKLHQPTKVPSKTISPELAAAVKRRRQDRTNVRRLTRRISRLENEVHQAMAVMDADSGKMLNYRQLMRNPKYKKEWSISSANEFGRLADGVGGRIKGTNTIKFIHRHDVPKERMKDVTYGQFVCTIRPEKAEKNRTRFTVGGDRINYPGEVATPTAEMLVAKLLFNSVISTRGAKFMTMDISNFYLMTPLSRPEYIRIKLCDLPEEIIQEYNLRTRPPRMAPSTLKQIKECTDSRSPDCWPMSC